MRNAQFKYDYVGWAIGVIAIAIAIWTYYESRLKPDLRFSIDPNRAVLVDTEASGIADFKVQYKGNTVFRNNVTAATLYLWNGGNAATHQKEILSPIKVSLPLGAEILDASIIRTSRKICGVQLRRLDALNQYGIDFNILEPRDGAAIQIIYIGTPSADIQVEGLIEGQDTISRVISNKTTIEEKGNPLAALRSGHWQFTLGFAIYIIGSMVFIFHYVERASRYRSLLDPAKRALLKRPSDRWIRAISSFLTLIGLFLVIVWNLGLFSSIPTSIANGR